jgi:hypothetical protein
MRAPSAHQHSGKAGGRGGSFSGTRSRRRPRHSPMLASTLHRCAKVRSTRMALRPTHPDHQPFRDEWAGCGFLRLFLRTQSRHVRSMVGVAGRRSIRVVRKVRTRAVLALTCVTAPVVAASVTGERPPRPSASARVPAARKSYVSRPLRSVVTNHPACNSAARDWRS